MAVWTCFIAVIFIFISCASSQRTSTAAEAIERTAEIVESYVDYIFGSICPFAVDVTSKLKTSLPSRIISQDEALSSILDSFSAWEFEKQSGFAQPLVLAFTGPTGVGKTETAFQMANFLFAKKTRIQDTKRYTPNGLLSLRGEDYTPGSEIASEGLPAVHRDIRCKIVEHLKRCSGNALIIFDEVQKVMPGALEVLLPAMERNGKISCAEKDRTAASYRSTAGSDGISTANVVFIFISDIGYERMLNLLLHFEERSAIPKKMLRSEVKTALDEQWDRLKFGRFISGVVPFLPLEQQHIKKILTNKLLLMAADYRNNYWLDLVVDDAVQELMAGRNHIQYERRTAKLKPKATPAAGAVAGAGPTEDQTKDVVKIFAKYGARNVETGGPLQDLRTMFFKYMMPWRPDHVLHVGLTDENTPASWAPKGGPKVQPGLWCRLDEAMLHPSLRVAPEPVCRRVAHDSPGGREVCEAPETWHIRLLRAFQNTTQAWISISSEQAYSDRCDTKWFGNFERDA